MNKFRPLRADEIECRIGQCKDNGLTLLLYKDARCDMNILDETVGAMNWRRAHLRENANCIVSIWDEDKREWVSKEDTGTESNTEAEKGLASDSFKRACVNWGIGRELYTAPFIWVNQDGANISNKKCYDRFTVKEIGYDESGNINALVIVNEQKGKVVFTLKKGKTAAPPAETKKETLICERCGKPLFATKGKDGSLIEPEDIAQIAQKKYGKTICSFCMKELAEAEKESK